MRGFELWIGLESRHGRGAGRDGSRLRGGRGSFSVVCLESRRAKRRPGFKRSGAKTGIGGGVAAVRNGANAWRVLAARGVPGGAMGAATPHSKPGGKAMRSTSTAIRNDFRAERVACAAAVVGAVGRHARFRSLDG